MSRPTIKVDYLSRDYTAIRADLVTLVQQQLKEIYPNLQWDADDPSDFGVVLLEMFAYMGDIMSAYIDRAANETSIDNAVLKSTLYNMAQLYGYRPSGPTQAVTTLSFTNNSASTVSIPLGTQVVANLTHGAVTEVFFETTADAVEVAAGATVSNVPAIEGCTSNTTAPGGISGTTHLPIPVLLVDSTGSATSTGLPSQERTISDTGIVDGSVVAYVGQGTSFKAWKFVHNLIESSPLDNAFTTRVNADGTTSVLFGDGINGAIPSAGHTLSAMYKTSVGYSGNIDANTIDTNPTFMPGSSVDVNNIVVTNTASSGGADPDSATQIKKKLKKAILSRSRAVTLADYEALASLVPRVGRVRAASGNPRAVTLYAQTQNDNTISPGLDINTGLPTAAWDLMKVAIEQYLSDKVQIGTTVTVVSPVYVDIKLTLEVTAASNYRNADVKTAVENALVNPNGGHFSYDTYEFGDLVEKYNVEHAVRMVTGVSRVNISVMDLASSLTPGIIDIQLGSNELPRLLLTNLAVTVVGGLA
jgi:hypothetical protein